MIELTLHTMTCLTSLSISFFVFLSTHLSSHFILQFFMIYFNADPVASPVEYSKFYSEKFIYMPNSFLANSFAYQQPDMKIASMVLPKNDNPSKNRCGIMLDIGNSNGDDDDDGDSANLSPKSLEKESFIFCNFNKQLKFDPDLFSHWLDTLQAVDNSYLCLLENPKESKEFITEFTKNHSPNLVKRIGYLPFINNPYENQQRNARYCHVILDTTVYNGHTTAADALWGGVPVVTRGDGVDMGSRVGASILTALNLPELIGSDQENYNDIALNLALDKEFYAETRSKLIHANHAKAPMNAFWDLQRYVRNLESGFESIWDTFIHGRDVDHVYVVDSGSSDSGVEGSETYRAVVDDIEDREDAPLILESNSYKNTLESEIRKPRNTAAKKQKKKQSTEEKKSKKIRQRSKRKRRRKNGRSRRRSLSEEL
jgi:Glycosyl transferase family 41